ncbi:MAG: LacI family DNA-binding transcriptional regulator [Spirochaetaceae bacterium]|nr:LacI family DNA-binding transcriptional regulator [Spirochaetaceae bacterium]
MATQKEVAELAGVSFITVSRVINEMGNVKEETRKKVQAAIEELNYYPNILGRGLNQGLTKTIGVVASIPEDTSLESNQYYSSLLEGIESICREKRFDLLLSTQRITDMDFDYLRIYFERKADGMIFLGDTDLSEKEINIIDEENIPCVIIGDRTENGKISFVDTDNIQGGYDCTKRLIELGHKRIAFLSVTSLNLNIHDRVIGYKNALEESGITIDENLIGNGDYTETSGYNFMKYILELENKPTALISGTDHMAFGAFAYTLNHGIQVPEDISLVGFDAMDLIRFTNPPLSSNKQPLVQMGKEAAEMLFHRIKNPYLDKEFKIFKISEFPGKSIADLRK